MSVIYKEMLNNCKEGWEKGWEEKDLFSQKILELLKRLPWNVRHAIDLPEDTDRSNEQPMAVKGRHATRIRKLVPTLSSSLLVAFASWLISKPNCNFGRESSLLHQRKSDFYYSNRVLSVNYEILGGGDSKILHLYDHKPSVAYRISNSFVDLIRN